MKKPLLFCLATCTSLVAATQPCNPGPGSRAAIGYRGPKGLGYDHGYATLSTFISPSGERPFQPFIDLRGHVFNDGKLAANAGLGGRYACDKAIVGLNAYYDYRDTNQLGSQNQVGGGFELLSKWADLRINGYVPVGNTTGKECPCFDHFACHSAFARQVVKASLADIDAEIGFYIPKLNYVDLYFAIGPYYLFEKTVCDYRLGGEWGGRARVSLKVYDGITLGGDVTYDPIFNTKAQGWITLSFPFGPANRVQNSTRFTEKYPAPCDEPARQFARMTQPVYRNEIIPVENKTRIFDILCECCCPSQIYFVNNCNCNEGCGTFENPFTTLIDAENNSCPSDIIYVFPGDGTSNGMDSGFIMKDCQRLISSAVPFDLCDICIPACTPGNLPVIENPNRTFTLTDPQTGSSITGGFGVLMTDCTEVAGFCLDGTNKPNDQEITTGIGLFKGNSFIVRNNVISNFFGSGILSNGFTPIENGNVVINGNCINNLKSTPSFFSGSSNAIGGIFLIASNSTLSFCNNTIQDLKVESADDDVAIGAIIVQTNNSNVSFRNNCFRNFSTSSVDQDSDISGIIIGSNNNNTFCVQDNAFLNFNGSSIGENLSADCEISAIFIASLSSSSLKNDNFVICGNSFQDLTTITSGDEGSLIDTRAIFARQTDLVNCSLNISNNCFKTLSATNTSTTPGRANSIAIEFQNLENTPSLFCNNTFQDITATIDDPVSDTLAIGIRIDDITGSFSACNNTFQGLTTMSTNSNFVVAISSGIFLGRISGSFSACNNALQNISSTIDGGTVTALANGITIDVLEGSLSVCNNSFRNFTATATGASMGTPSSALATGLSGSLNLPSINDIVIAGSATLCSNSFQDFASSASGGRHLAETFAALLTVQDGSLIANNNCINNFSSMSAAGDSLSTSRGLGIFLGNSTSSICNNSFNQIISSSSTSALADGINARTSSTSLAVRNNRFQNISVSGPGGFADLNLVDSNGSSTYCVENNTFSSVAQFVKNGSDSLCLRLFDNTSTSTYNLGLLAGTLNVESPDLTNLQAGLESINTGTVSIAGAPTAVPLGRCKCSDYPCSSPCCGK